MRQFWDCFGGLWPQDPKTRHPFVHAFGLPILESPHERKVPIVEGIRKLAAPRRRLVLEPLQQGGQRVGSNVSDGLGVPFRQFDCKVVDPGMHEPITQGLSLVAGFAVAGVGKPEQADDERSSCCEDDLWAFH